MRIKKRIDECKIKKNIFGERLKKLRTDKRLTQQALSDILNVNRMTIVKWEKGSSEPTISKIKQLADYFETDVNCLVGEEVCKTKSQCIVELEEQLSELKADNEEIKAQNKDFWEGYQQLKNFYITETQQLQQQLKEKDEDIVKCWEMLTKSYTNEQVEDKLKEKNEEIVVLEKALELASRIIIGPFIENKKDLFIIMECVKNKARKELKNDKKRAKRGQK